MLGDHRRNRMLPRFTYMFLAGIALLGKPQASDAGYTLVGCLRGHTYYRCDPGTWDQCRTAGIALGQQLGVPAYLATIDTAEEEAYINSACASSGARLWIGLYFTGPPWVPHWVNGASTNFMRFCPGEPNHFFWQNPPCGFE